MVLSCFNSPPFNGSEPLIKTHKAGSEDSSLSPILRFIFTRFMSLKLLFTLAVA